MRKTIHLTVSALALVAFASAACAAGTKRPSERTMAIYKQSTWRAYEQLVAKSTSQADKPGIPDTDCPPLPTEECAKTWKILTIDPFK